MNKNINEIVAVTGLLLTLTTFLFNIAWPSITKSLLKDENTSGPKAREKIRKEILGTFFFKAIPLFFGFVILFYLNLPTAYKIASYSNIRLWDFDVDKTLYMALEIALLMFVIFNGYISVKLFLKYMKFRS